MTTTTAEADPMPTLTPPGHPAPFSTEILDALAELTARRLTPESRVLDPFAGTGRIHQLAYASTGVELEREWARMHRRTIVGDATALPFPANTFDAVITSPTYGNRMADCHDARDASYRRTYRHLLGRPLTTGSAGGLQWGPPYRDLHRRAWVEAVRVLRPGGWMFVNVKDHIRTGRVQHVVDWHLRTLTDLGLDLVHEQHVPTPGARYGANGRLRVGHEVIAELWRPA